MIRTGLTLVVVVVLGVSAAESRPRPVDHERSGITFVTRQMNVPVEGRFRKFKAEIVFDEAAPEAGAAFLEVDVASATMDSEEADTEIVRRTWLHAAGFPVATFRSREVRPLGGNRYEAVGDLAIKGTTREVTVPFTMSPQPGGGAQVSGELHILRADFDVGEGIWSRFDTVANEVLIRFRLELGPGPAAG